METDRSSGDDDDPVTDSSFEVVCELRKELQAEAARADQADTEARRWQAQAIAALADADMQQQQQQAAGGDASGGMVAEVARLREELSTCLRRLHRAEAANADSGAFPYNR